MAKSKDDIILQQMEVIRTMAEHNLNRMNTDFWGAPKAETPEKPGEPPKPADPAGAGVPTDPQEKAAEEAAPPPEKIEDLVAELDSYIGLGSIKQEVRNLTDKENGVVDLYAVWEINTVSLTIRTRSLDTNQSYVFQVEGTGLNGTGIDLKVILDANDSQTIVDLPAGTYTIRNEQGWSWRYEVKSETKDVHAATVVAEFSNWQNTAKIYWLNGYGNQQIKRKQNSN